MSEFQVGGHIYSAGKLNARQQFHVARRFAPVIKGLGGVVEQLGGVIALVDAAKSGDLRTRLFGLDPFAIAQPLADALAEMKEADVDYIIDLCLSVTQRKIGTGATGWGPVSAPNGLPMYTDMSWLDLAQIAVKVVEVNLLNFTRATA